MSARRIRLTRGSIRLLLLLLGSVGALIVAAQALGAAPALAAAPVWQVFSEAAPTHLPPGGEGLVVVKISNLGDAPATGATTPVTVDTHLPNGLQATAIRGQVSQPQGQPPVECALSSLSCSYTGVVNPYEQVTVTISVKVEEPPGTSASLSSEVSVDGGGAAPLARVQHLLVDGTPAGFGIAGYQLAPVEEDGAAATQAGGHPFQLTTTLVMNQTAFQQPVALPKDLQFELPPGLLGDPDATAQCSMTNFSARILETNLCSPNNVIGVATVTVNEPLSVHVVTRTVPVFNLVPSRGEPARFGFVVLGLVPIVIDTAVRSGRDYGVIASVQNATQTAGLLSSQVSLWGVPGDPRHDGARGWECVAGGYYHNQVGKPCPSSTTLPQTAFLRMPTSCPANPGSEPLTSSMQADSWALPGGYLSSEYAWLSDEGGGLSTVGCGALPFNPSIYVSPEQTSASTPTGLTVEVSVPQATTLEPEGVGEADLRDTTVTLPAGVQLSPAAANGLEACSEAQMGFTGVDPQTQTNQFHTAPASCPVGSKLGVVHIKTPLLPRELEGTLYLATPAPSGEAGMNPFDSLVAVYLVAEDPVSGVLVKLAGEGQLNKETLQVSTTFRNTPQVPFEQLRLELFGGPRASVSTPAFCGTYGTQAAFSPWSGTGPLNRTSPPGEFSILSGVDGSGCPLGSLPFAPGMEAHSTSTRAGGFTSFALELSRPDGDQALGAVTVHLPRGVAAMLATVELCDETQANASACPVSSEIGQAVAIAGLGPEPYEEVGGRVFITGPYEGAPFGLEIVTPAKAGPFDLGFVTVRSKLYVDPSDASVTVVSDPLPTQVRGIPLQLKRVLVMVDRSNFEFNPTSCDPTTIEGSISGSEGASTLVHAPFQVGECGSLPFSPQFTASAVGQGSKAEGTTFAVTVRSGGVGPNGVAQTGIAKVQLQLPKQLSSRLPTLQKACVDAVFNTNPATCGEGSVIGYATIHTPVLKSPLTGPAYLVSHGGAAFPDVEFVLQGEGIKLVLDGKTDIKGEVTYSRFESTPDAPFTVFETVLPAGPHGVLTPNVPESKRFSLCGETLVMPTTMIAQNGARIDQETRVQVTGCGEVRSAKVSKLTLKQQLTRALRFCKHKHRHATRKRAACERQAHARYIRQALAACRHEHKHAKRKRQACERAADNNFAAKGVVALTTRKSKGAKG
jgi:hypothetical protein